MAFLLRLSKDCRSCVMSVLLGGLAPDIVTLVRDEFEQLQASGNMKISLIFGIERVVGSCQILCKN